MQPPTIDPSPPIASGRDFLKTMYFLWKCQLRNQLKRTTTSPRRLIPILIFIIYLGFILVTTLSEAVFVRPPSFAGQMQYVHAIAFAFFAFFWLLSLVSISNFGTTTQLAEIEVLFPTPVPQKTVFLYRFCRTLAASLFLPLLLRIIYSVRAEFTLANLTLNHVPIVTYVNIAMVAYFMQATMVTCLGYAYAIYIRRDTPLALKLNNLYQWIVGSFLVIAVAYVAAAIYMDGFISGIIKVTDNPIFQAAFLPAQLGTWMVQSPEIGSLWCVLGVAGYLLIAAIAYRACIQGLDWFYDLSATKGSILARKLQAARSGNFRTMNAELAKSGRIKARGKGLAERIRVQGNASFLWREVALSFRRNLVLTLVMFAVGTFYASMPFLMSSARDSMTGQSNSAFIFGSALGMQAIGIFYAMTTLIQTGVPYFFQQTEMIKSLPFSCTRIVAMEVLSKAWLPVLIVPVSCIVDFFIAPETAKIAVAALIFSPSVSFLFSSIWYYAYILLPDYSDVAQRFIRSLLAMALMAVSALPVIGLLFVGYLIQGPILAAILGALTAIGETVLFTYFAGRGYDNYIMKD